MNGEELVAAVRKTRGTELDRLGSEKALVAKTAATLEPDAVLSTAAATSGRAVETYEEWAASETEERTRTGFADMADKERARYESIVAAMAGEPDDQGGDPLHEYLRTLDGTVERVAAGLVGRPLVASRLFLQVVNFFINEGDTRNTERFRKIRDETDDLVVEGTTLLEAVCVTDEDWERAREAAEEAIGVAYEEYAATLHEMGLDPKPVC